MVVKMICSDSPKALTILLEIMADEKSYCTITLTRFGEEWFREGKAFKMMAFPSFAASPPSYVLSDGHPDLIPSASQR